MYRGKWVLIALTYTVKMEFFLQFVLTRFKVSKNNVFGLEVHIKSQSASILIWIKLHNCLKNVRVDILRKLFRIVHIFCYQYLDIFDTLPPLLSIVIKEHPHSPLLAECSANICSTSPLRTTFF